MWRAVWATLAILTLFVPAPVAQDVTNAESLLDQATTEGTRYLQTRDDRAKNTAKKALESAEKSLKDELKRNASCEKCSELLVLTYARQAYFGFSKNYYDCIEFAGQAIQRFPTNGRIAMYLGTALYNTGRYAEAIHYFKRYLASSMRDAGLDEVATKAMQDAQQKFQTSWYNQANFYQSPESRVTRPNPQTFAQEVIFQVTPDWELATANQLAPTLLQQAPLLQDGELQTYLDQLVARLTSRTPGPSYTYRLSVLNSPVVNAVTMPGQIVVYSGLLQAVDTEAELAGVLAHELGHNYGHHPARTVIKQYYAQNLFNTIAGAVNPQGQVAQAVTGIVSSIGLDLFMRAYSRFEEKEADLYGAHILYNAGYNPTAMSEMHLKMYQRNPKQPIKFLSTHPPSPDRAEYISDYLDAFDLARALSVDSEAFKKIKTRFPSAAAQTPAGPPQIAP